MPLPATSPPVRRPAWCQILAFDPTRCALSGALGTGPGVVPVEPAGTPACTGPHPRRDKRTREAVEERTRSSPDRGAELRERRRELTSAGIGPPPLGVVQGAFCLVELVSTKGDHRLSSWFKARRLALVNPCAYRRPGTTTTNGKTGMDHQDAINFLRSRARPAPRRTSSRPAPLARWPFGWRCAARARSRVSARRGGDRAGLFHRSGSRPR